MIVGYARTSTAEQSAGLAAQERDLRAAGCEKLFTEQVSSVGRRPELERALDFVREGDTFIITKPDRLARSTADLLGLVARLDAKSVDLVILSMGGQRVETASPTGKLMLTMLAAVAAFERDLMLERQREGIAKAKADGRYKGRVPTVRRRRAEILDLHAKGLKPTAIARSLGVGRASVYRVLEATRAAAGEAPLPRPAAA
jgi:DNA invertase Pin-like site-specific DNA recombinase